MKSTAPANTYLNDAQACGKIYKISKIWKVTDMNMIGTQNIETKRCLLRRIRLEDYKMMYENWAYAFHKIGLNRVQAEVFSGNTASEHVLLKCGMQYEGIARQKYYKNGTFIDTAQYAVLRQDYEALTHSTDSP